MYGRSKKDILAAMRAHDSPPQILYFYCHALTGTLNDSYGADSAELTMTKKEKIRLVDLKGDAPEDEPLPGAPLVFINACESAKLSPLYYGGFMKYFTAKGARGMIGTECSIPAVFASAWARRFFDCFLSGRRPLGKVFLDLRQEFLDEHNNLLGLLYAVYGDGDTVVEPGL